MNADGRHPARHQHRLDAETVQCDLCPHHCRLKEDGRGICYVRACRGGQIVLTVYGRVSGFAVDPIEKKPLYHFLPGSRSLSFGVIGCNLSCRFCQNWHISKPSDGRALGAAATPGEIAAAAVRHGCPSVSFTYNEPIVSLEFTLDVARACRERGLRNVAVTAGYIEPGPAREFFGLMDAANVDLKAFTDDFYRRLCGARLQPVLDTLALIRDETSCWLETTTLLIPGENDGDEELATLSAWVAGRLGRDVPAHFSAFFPTCRLEDRPSTPPATLSRARRIARDAGLCHVYTGNVRDGEGSATRCASCGAVLIERDGFLVTRRTCGSDGSCPACGARCAGVFG